MTDNILETVFQQYIHKSKYARWDEEKGRRENWDETVDRYIEFFKEHLLEKCGYKIPEAEIKRVRKAILDLEVMPSMRCLKTAGEALKRDNGAGYNCGFMVIDKKRKFDELMYSLLCGTGVGFSVERQFINKLPTVADNFYPTDTTIHVADSKIGWAVSYKELISLLYSGQVPKWNMSKVRPAGARLKVFGGTASGPRPLEVEQGGLL
jgi:ribonucleoside-diphosphate reductase alpha chain